ncbi:glycosyltransferase family 2 protein [Geothermobacter hydrogeniphilus]|uniref:Glycosyltransferase family 2 protein n=1 Tax=Geothermobacter hydrogeniphilus TaxID=1969733 RepID=A0A2K2H9S5_9BACT|nr:glycosyltransferase family 2 protein [Geothermobacter hydrogeniphilus]PNU19983.1 glycosyltransferase family 2 protein [Geothermobacter hydrogeniphilus]
MLILFYGSIFMIAFAYFGYPLSLLLLSRFRSRPVARRAIAPSVTLIITVFNEEARIRPKLENTLALDYPREKLQVLVASDGSTDATNSIVESYRDRGIELLPVRVRGGKENAQKEAVEQARGDVLVFSDVATMLDPEGLRKMVANFADPAVGCVSSVDRVLDKEGRPGGEGAYVRYEMWLRSLESSVHSLVGLSGSFFAARREVCSDFSADMQSDFRTLLNSMRLGLRGVSDPQVVGYYPDVADQRREFDRKVRTVLRGLTVFFRNLEFLNPRRYGFFSYQYLCHKLLRWLVPLFMATALISNLWLASGSVFYSLLFCVHFGSYLAVGWSWWRRALPAWTPLKIPVYFVVVNAAILLAWWRYLGGRRQVMWTPSQR